ncbi:hypothetical protein Bbelb_048270 [Branchiostoma belcheri]|nr:hypothetical protein Bbelb_048270 [Branchiostoma belcheri]
MAGEVLQDDRYDFLRHSGQLYVSDSDVEDKSVVWVKPSEWRAPRLTYIVLRCQAVLDQNRNDRRLPFSNKERKRKPTEFTDRRPPNGRAAEDYSGILPEPNQDHDGDVEDQGGDVEDHDGEDRDVEDQGGDMEDRDVEDRDGEDQDGDMEDRDVEQGGDVEDRNVEDQGGDVEDHDGEDRDVDDQGGDVEDRDGEDQDGDDLYSKSRTLKVIGDQATCKNIRGARRFRQDDVDDLEKLTWARMSGVYAFTFAPVNGVKGKATGQTKRRRYHNAHGVVKETWRNTRKTFECLFPGPNEEEKKMMLEKVECAKARMGGAEITTADMMTVLLDSYLSQNGPSSTLSVHQNQQLFVVAEDKIQHLLATLNAHFKKCDAKVTLRQVIMRGHAGICEIRCPKGCSYQWASSPYIRGIFLGNLRNQVPIDALQGTQLTRLLRDRNGTVPRAVSERKVKLKRLLGEEAMVNFNTLIEAFRQIGQNPAAQPQRHTSFSAAFRCLHDVDEAELGSIISTAIANGRPLL